MYSASTSTAPTTISREFQEPPCFPASPEYHPWISRRLEVATMPHPRSNRRGQDGCPSSAHLHPSYPPTPPQCPPYPPTYPPRTSGAARQLTHLIRRGEGETRRGRGDQPGRRGRRNSTTAEEEAVQRKIGSRKEHSCLAGIH